MNYCVAQWGCLAQTPTSVALGAFAGTIASGGTGGRLLVYSAMTLYNDGAIVALALHP